MQQNKKKTEKKKKYKRTNLHLSQKLFAFNVAKCISKVQEL